MRTMKILGTMAAVWVGWFGVSLAGQLNAPAAPTNTLSAMHTLNDIYNRLSTGATNTATTFTEPTTGPTNGTMCTLDDIYGLAGQTRVPKTGETPTLPSFTPNPAGSDGNLQKGFPLPNPRFSALPAGATGQETNQIRDNLTGLIWARDANIASNTGWSANGSMTWSNAFIFVSSTSSSGLLNQAGGTYGGTNDWRVPNVRELFSLLALQFDTPCISDATGTNKWSATSGPFTGVRGSSSDAVNYWSSSSARANGSYPGGFHVSTWDASVGNHDKGTTCLVWPVRGP